MRPYENIENYSWDTTLGHQSRVAGEGGGRPKPAGQMAGKEGEKGSGEGQDLKCRHDLRYNYHNHIAYQLF